MCGWPAPTGLVADRRRLVESRRLLGDCSEIARRFHQNLGAARGVCSVALGGACLRRVKLAEAEAPNTIPSPNPNPSPSAP